MTVLITLTTAGTDSGPFNLYSNLDGYVSAFETGISKSLLVAGYASSLVPDYTTIIRVVSQGVCTNHVDIVLVNTSTTTTSSSTTTTTTTILPCYNYSVSTYTTGGALYTDCNGNPQSITVGGIGGFAFQEFCASDTPIATGDGVVNINGVCMT